MTTYYEMIDRHESETEAFPMKFAFNDKQLEEVKRELGSDELVHFGAGAVMRASDMQPFIDLTKGHRTELLEAMQDYDFALDAFAYELANHEYVISRDVKDTLDNMGISRQILDKSEEMKRALADAAERVVKQSEKGRY